MTVIAVVGAQWGDEGKGRVVDYLAQRARVLCAFRAGITQVTPSRTTSVNLPYT